MNLISKTISVIISQLLQYSVTSTSLVLDTTIISLLYEDFFIIFRGKSHPIENSEAYTSFSYDIFAKPWRRFQKITHKALPNGDLAKLDGFIF